MANAIPFLLVLCATVRIAFQRSIYQICFAFIDKILLARREKMWYNYNRIFLKGMIFCAKTVIRHIYDKRNAHKTCRYCKGIYS